MSSVYHKVYSFFYFVFFAAVCCVLSGLYAQQNGQVQGSESFVGTWENNERIVSFTLQDDGTLHADIVLKPFYRYYYDGIYPPAAEESTDVLAVMDNGLYTQFWTPGQSSSGVLWLPRSNRTEFSIDGQPIQKELKGYFVLNNNASEITGATSTENRADTEYNTAENQSAADAENDNTDSTANGAFTGTFDNSAVYEIRYWLTKAEYTDEKAELHIGSGSVILLEKYIKIGSAVYTCAVGRRKKIRNLKRIGTLPLQPRVSVLGNLLVLTEPYLVRSDIGDLQAEITKHNGLRYPPHDGRARFVEPSIYKKLENMNIEDF
ncbi:hypothetical protein [Treponema lecithinolyticum]